MYNHNLDNKMTKFELNNICKTYHSTQVVRDVTITIKGGEVVGLLGPNGAGKTTSFYIAVGLIAADKGNILLNKQDITHLSVHARARLGISYLPQEASIFRKLSVADNIMSILELRRDLNKKQRREKLETLLEEFNLTTIRNHLGMRVSGGERRRTEIARTLALEPQFILLDEPFAGIDPISVLDIKRIITQLCKKGIGILITDHNVRETLTICQRAYIVNKGQLICQGNAQDVLDNQQVREVYLGDEFNL